LCCEFYKDHSQHAEVSSQEQILKQHVAYQSLDQTKQKSKNLDIGSIPTASSVSSDVHNDEYTAVFNAFESSGNYNDGGNDSAAPASQHAAKKPARNTKSDLLRRYQIVKGHPWNGDSSITAKALKIIVRELEALASGKAASDAATNTAAMEVFKSSKKLPVKSESKSNSKSKSKKKAKRSQSYSSSDSCSSRDSESCEASMNPANVIATTSAAGNEASKSSKKSSNKSKSKSKSKSKKIKNRNAAKNFPRVATVVALVIPVLLQAVVRQTLAKISYQS
jgi:hypothetical protein